MLLTDVQIAQFIGQYFWPFVRIGAFFLAVPVIGSQLISPRVRVVLAVFLTLLVVPLLPPLPVAPSLSLGTLLIVVQQLVIGLALGFVFQVVFQLFVLAGQFIAMKMGLGFASMNDPANGVQVTIVSQYYLMLTTLLFVSVNGHLVVTEIMIESFYSLPISYDGLGVAGFWQIASMGSWMFKGGLLIALPLLTSLLVVNLAFGVMSRAAPQMNVFAVGFPITLVFGVFLMWAGLASFLPSFDRFVREGFEFLRLLVGVP